MALDPSIALGVRVAPFDLRIPTPVDRYTRLLAVQQMTGQAEAQRQLAEQRRFALEQSRLEAQREEKARIRLGSGEPLSIGEAYKHFGATGGAKYLEAGQKAQTAALETEEKQRGALTSIAGGILQANSQEGLERGVMDAMARGVVSQDEGHELIGLPWNEQTRAQVEQIYRRGIGGKEQHAMTLAAQEAGQKAELHAPALAKAEAEATKSQWEQAAQYAPEGQAAWDVWHARLPAALQAQISPMYSPTERARVQATLIKPEIGKTHVRPPEVQAQIESEDAARIRAGLQGTYSPERFRQEQTLRAVAPTIAAATRAAARPGDEGTIAAVLENPVIWNQLDKTTKGRLVGPLAKAGFKEFGKDLSETAIKHITETQTGLESIRDLIPDMERHKDLQGPIVGLLAKVPYAEQARTLQAHIDLIKQRVGKAFEGGVLRKEDEEKYKKILPTMQDTPLVALNKARMVERELARDMDIYTNAQMAAGRRVPEALRSGGGAAPGGAAKINTKEEYDKLPSGTQYVDAQDGKTYTKR